MKLIWSASAWEDYLYWENTDKKITKRINELIKSCMRTPFEGIGKPEALKGDLQGYWSRRITAAHRLVCKPEKERFWQQLVAIIMGNKLGILEKNGNYPRFFCCNSCCTPRRFAIHFCFQFLCKPRLLF